MHVVVHLTMYEAPEMKLTNMLARHMLYEAECWIVEVCKSLGLYLDSPDMVRQAHMKALTETVPIPGRRQKLVYSHNRQSVRIVLIDAGV